MTASQSSQVKLTAQMVHALGEILGKARELKVKHVALLETEQGPMAQFLVPGESGAPQDIKRIAHAAIKPEWFPALCEVLLNRTFQWSAPDDILWITNPKSVRRLYYAPPTGEVTAANLTVRRPIGAKSDQLILDFAGWDLTSSFWDIVGTTGRSRAVVEQALSKPSGLILVSASGHKHAVEGGAVCAAFRPDAVLLRDIADLRSASEALSLAQAKLVVIELPAEDPVDMLVNFRALLARDPEQERIFQDLVNLAFIYRRVKRVCGACARSSAIDPHSLLQFPEVVRPPQGQTYMLGRGCEQCHHAAYLGSVEIESVLVVDAEMRELLKLQGSAVQLATQAYKSGTRTMMEAGLQKVYQGQTSFEEVARVAKTVSEVFRAAIVANRPRDAKEAPKDEQVKEAFSAISADFFAENGSKSSGFRLLVIEDDPEQLEILKLVFGKEGYDVRGAANGADALDLLTQARVDLVICDLMMPVMNGQEFVQALRKQERIKNLPVLVLTAVSNPETEVDLLSVGADDYCCKDVNRKVLLKRVEKLLKKSRNSLRQLLSA